MKKTIASLLCMVMLLGLLPTMAFADWGEAAPPVTSLSVEAVGGGNVNLLKAGDQVMVTVSTSGLTKHWNSYQFDLVYDSDVFLLELGEWGFDPDEICADLKTLFGPPTSNTDRAGHLIVTGSTQALSEATLGKNGYFVDPVEKNELRTIVSIAATFTVKNDANVGETTFEIATNGETPYQVGFTTASGLSPVTTSSGAMERTVTIARELKDEMIVMDRDTFVYTGSVQSPVITVTDDNTAVGSMFYTVTGDTSKTFAGSYSLSVTGKDGYLGSFTRSWRITDAPLTVSGSGEMSVYTNGTTFRIPEDVYAVACVDGQAPAVTFTAEPDCQCLSVTADGEITPKAEGTAVITASASAPNHQDKSTSIVVTVRNKDDISANVTFTAKGDGSRVYDGVARPLSDFLNAATCTAGEGNIAYTLNGAEATLAGTIRDAGRYTVVATYEDDTHVGQKQQVIEITKAPLTIAAVAITGKEYDGTTTVAADKIGAVTFSGLQNGETLTAGIDYTVTADYSGKNVGSKTVAGTVSLITDGAAAKNYSLSDGSFTTSGVEIDKKTITITGLTAENKTYDASAAATVSDITVTGLAADESLSLTDFVVTDSAFTGADAGTGKAVSATVALADSAKAGNYSLAGAVEGKVTARGNANITMATALSFREVPSPAPILANDSRNATQEAFDAYAAACLPATITVTYAAGKTQEMNLLWTEAQAFDPKGGDYTFTGTIQSDANIDTSMLTTDPSVMISVAPVFVTGVTNVDNSAIAAVNSSRSEALADGATLAALGLPETVKLSFDNGVAAQTVAARWDKTMTDVVTAANSVNEGNQSADVDVKLLAASMPAWATAADAALPTVKLTITNKLAVDPADIVITGLSKTYDETKQEPAAAIAAEAIAGKYESQTFTYTHVYKQNGQVVEPLNAGVYEVTVTAESSKYLGSQTAQLVISPKSVAVTWTDTALTYTGLEQKPTATAEGAVLTVSGGQIDAGDSYTAAASTADGNYTLTNVTTSFSIAPRTILAEHLSDDAIAVTKVYDGTVDAPNASGAMIVNGVNGETLQIAVASVGSFADRNVGGDKTVTLTIGALTGSGEAKAANYKLTDGLTTYTFRRAAITPAAYAYNGPDGNKAVKAGSGLSVMTANASAAGVNGETLTGTVAWYTDDACTTAAVDGDLSGLSVGASRKLYWRFTPADGGNYAPAYKTGSVTVNITAEDPQVLSFAAQALSRIYGDAMFTNTLSNRTNEGTAIADGGTITYGSSNTEVAVVDENGQVTIVGVGETTITASAARIPGKYAAAAESYTLTVAQREVTLTWNDCTGLTYDNTEKAVTAAAGALVGEDVCTVTVSGGTQTNAGDYTATAVALSNRNYKLPDACTQDFTIAKADRGDITFKDGSGNAMNGPVTLTQARRTLRIVPSVAEDKDLDNSASFLFRCDNGSALSVLEDGTLTAVSDADGITVTVTAPATANYHEKTVALTIHVDLTPIDSIAVALAEGDTASELMASVDNEKKQISLFGLLAEGKTATVHVNGRDDAIFTVVNDEAGIRSSAADGKVTVGDAAFVVDLSGVQPLPAEIAIRELPPTIDADGVTLPEDGVLPSDQTTVSEAAADGLMASAAAELISGAEEEASKVGEDETVSFVTVESGFEITLVEIKSSANDGAVVASVILDITPVQTITVTVSNDGGTVTKEPVTRIIPNSAIQTPIRLTITIPSTLYEAGELLAKHNGRFIPVSKLGGNRISWWQDSFSPVEILPAKTTAIRFTFADGHTESRDYTNADIGSALPVDVKGSDSFHGWILAGDNAPEGTHRLLTEELLTAMNGKSYTAVSSFTPYVSPVTGGGGGGGSSSAAAYAVNIAEAAHGSVSAEPKAANRGRSITLSVMPDRGYALETLTVTDKNGASIEVKRMDAATYTFSMPASDVEVKASFMEDNSMLNFFVDVSAEDYYYDAVLWAAKNKITEGTSDTTFSPDDPCTRAQVVTFLWRAAGCPRAETANPFRDVAEGAYYYDAVLWAVEQGITSGTSDATFSPDGICTRGQIVTFLYRYAKSPAMDAAYTGFADVEREAYYADAVIWAAEQKVTMGTGDAAFSPEDNCTRGQIVTFLYRWFDK